MKRIGNLFDKIIDIDNLRLADEKARKGKRKSYGVRTHDKNLEANLLRLHKELMNETYSTSKYDTFVIHEPKELVISRLPYYPDRIVHHAIMNVLEPIWYKVYTHNQYACIKGRGIHACAREVRRIINSFKGQPLYCLKLDIRKFYPSIDHDIMKSIVRKKIKCERTLRLLDNIIDSTNGLPIGNYTSQSLANLYLAYLMHYINEELHKELGISERIKATLYADDMVLFASDKSILHKVFSILQQRLSELNLEFKGNWQIFPIKDNPRSRYGRALDYVGYQFFRLCTLLRKSIKKNYCKAIAKLSNGAKSKKAVTMALAPWLGWLKHCNGLHINQILLVNL